jgi:hypothetical protein
MATPTGRARCVKCEKERIAYKCEGCLEYFCLIHLPEHHQILGKELEEIENKRNLFREILIQQKTNTEKHLLIEQIHQWKHQSIHRIETTAREAERLVFKSLHEQIGQTEIQLKNFTEQLQTIREDDDFNEIVLSQLREKLKELEEQLNKPSNISIQEDSSSFIKQISVVISSRKCFRNIYPHKKFIFQRKSKFLIRFFSFHAKLIVLLNRKSNLLEKERLFISRKLKIFGEISRIAKLWRKKEIFLKSLCL